MAETVAPSMAQRRSGQTGAHANNWLMVALVAPTRMVPTSTRSGPMAVAV
jgi:hypothetical protein